MKMDKSNYPQVYLEEFKYKIKNEKIPEVIDAELELDFSSDSEWFTRNNVF